MLVSSAKRLDVHTKFSLNQKYT